MPANQQQAPATLPADFSQWDTPESLPADFSGWDAGAQGAAQPESFAEGFVRPTKEMWKNPIGIGQGGLVKGEPPVPGEHFNLGDAISSMTPESVWENFKSSLGDFKALNPIADNPGETAANLIYLATALRPGAAKNASRPTVSLEGIKQGAKAAGERVAPVAKVAAQEAFSHVPVAGRAVQRPSYGDWWRAGKEVVKSKPKFPSEVQGPRMETGQFDLNRFDGEYVDPAPIPQGRDIPFAPSEVVFPKALPESASVPRDMPYRRGPGEVPGDIVGTPNDRVLAGGAGIRTTARGLLPEPAKMWDGEPPAQKGPQGIGERRQDMAIMDAMREDMARQERAGLGAERREFADNNSMDVPKWKRNAEAKAELLLQQAEAKAKAPVKYTKTVTPKPKRPKLSVMDVVQSPDDLSGALEESIRRAQAAKGGR